MDARVVTGQKAFADMNEEELVEVINFTWSDGDSKRRAEIELTARLAAELPPRCMWKAKYPEDMTKVELIEALTEMCRREAVWRESRAREGL